MNLYTLPEQAAGHETFFPLVSDQGILIEKIVSTGQTSPMGFWYNQERDEWVALLQGRAILAWEDGSQTELAAGDHILIPAHKQHRVAYTSSEPPCIWLAVHGNILAPQKAGE